jgi:hypothetical protein
LDSNSAALWSQLLPPSLASRAEDRLLRPWSRAPVHALRDSNGPDALTQRLSGLREARERLAHSITRTLCHRVVALPTSGQHIPTLSHIPTLQQNRRCLLTRTGSADRATPQTRQLHPLQPAAVPSLCATWSIWSSGQQSGDVRHRATAAQHNLTSVGSVCVRACVGCAASRARHATCCKCQGLARTTMSACVTYTSET